ncbi:LamG-like jellyroll fold domain-containing protein, partial [Nitrosopumilus adriaticus]|uniref:LamG-like jellyroll fold domain-containing protein n=1 Tax=Nitrosopumilus adriaticus TaxID=1580092 RepID=UPI00352F28C1
MFLILVLSTLSSGTDYVFSQSSTEIFEPTSRNFTIDLTEKIGFSETKKQSDKSKIFSVSLHEKISMTNPSVNDKIILIKYDSDRKIMMERIFDRQSKFEINNSKLLKTLLPSVLSSSSVNDDLDVLDNDIKFADHILSFDKFNLQLNDLILNTIKSEKSFLTAFNTNHEIFIQNNVELLNDQIFDPKNPILLILLIPFAGFVLIRFENEQTKFYQIKQFFTFAFIIILVSSAVITPMSISSSYWGTYAFGELDNSTEIISELDNSTEIISELDNSTEIISELDNSTEIISELDNSTEIILQNNLTDIFESNDNPLQLNYSEIILPESIYAKPNNQMSISDILSTTLSKFTGNATSSTSDLPSSNSFMSISDILSTTLSKFTGNATSSTSDLPSSNSFMSISDILSTTLSKFTGNATSSTCTSDLPSSNSFMSISDSLEIIFTPGFSIDDATLSLPFNYIENGTESQINDENSLQLDGDQDFIQLNENSTNNLPSLIIGAWVKPDYSHGSPVFTVVSKENSFSLTIDNQKTSHKAKFSIFDGIKWTEIQSSLEIPEEWTHLLASFDNQTLRIYVNGEAVGTTQLEGIISLSHDGQLETVEIENISSESDIVVGAYMTTKSGIPVPNNMFSGMIDDVALFDYAISDTQIGQLYSGGIASHSTQTKSLDEILREIEIEAGLHAELTDQTLQAQLFILDSLSFSHSQAQNGSQTLQAQTTSDSLQAQLSLSDYLSTVYSQAPNSTSASLVIPKITPILTPTKDTFTIAEDAEITFEFFDETEAMAQDLENLDVSLKTSETDIENAQNPSFLDDAFGLFVLPIPEADAAKDDKTSMKAKIKQLQKEIKQIKKSEKVSEAELLKIKNKIQLLIDQIKDEVKESKKQKKIDKLNSVIEKLEKITNKQQKQKDNWIDSKETITVEVYDANNNKAELDVVFEKQREGKFSIKIDPTNAKPGIYKIKSILNVDGKQYINESEFAWGLVSVNSIKSIYKPEETAELEIVVLNGTGAPVCPANIVMEITDPSLSSVILTSDDVLENSCGLYKANYPNTSLTGNYTVNIQANTGNGIVNFATYFTVLETFDYDIIRTTESKIDPFVDPNDFDVGIEIKSFVGDDEIIIREYVPSSFGVFNTDASIETIGDQKVLTWIRTPENGLLDTIEYSYSVPLITPQLYPLGQIQIEQNDSSIFTEARNWFVAVDPHFLIDASVTTNNDRWQDASKRTVAVNGSHVYTFYIDAQQDLAYSYSTNGGNTWIYGGELSNTADLYLGLATWYEPDTSGLTEDVIHIATYDGVRDMMFYQKFYPSSLTFSTLNEIGDGTTKKFGSLSNPGMVAITVGTNGDVYIGTVDNSSPTDPLGRIRVCDSSLSCESYTHWSNAGGSTVRNTIWGTSDDGSDSVILLPMEDDDIMLVSLDVSGHVLRSKIFDHSLGNWTSTLGIYDNTWNTFATGVTDSTTYDHGVSGIVDRETGDIYIAAIPDVASTSSEVRLYKYTSGAWTADSSEPKITTTDGSQRYVDVSLGIDDDAGKLYAIYNRGTSATSTNVYYKSADLPVTSWGTENQLTNSTSNFRGLSINNYNEELLYADFFDTSPNILYGSSILKKPLLKETLGISDSIVLGLVASRTLSESLSISDSNDAAVTAEISLSESLSISDTVIPKQTLSNIELSETLSILDVLSSIASLEITLSETLTESDIVDAAKRSPGDDPNARPLAVREFTGTSSNDPTDITISPALTDYTKAFAMCSFRHTGESLHNKVFRGWEIVDDSTLRIHATAKPPGPNSVDYVCNVIEFGSASTVQGSTQTFTQSASGSTTVTSNLGFGQTSVDLGETMEWYQGHAHDDNESLVGSEELDRVRLTSSTQWEWNVKTAPGSGPQDNYLGVFDWNNLDVNVQRGQTTISSGSSSKTLIADTDFTESERTRSLLFASFIKDDTAFDYSPNKSFIHATIESGTNNLVFSRNSGSSAPAIEINWTLVTLPEDFVKVRHGTHTQNNTQFNTTFDLGGGDSIVNTGKAFVIGTVCTPFGCGTGSGSSTNPGSIDRIQATLELDDENTIRVIRGDGTGTFTVGYQTIEFLPKKIVLSETLSASDNLVLEAFYSQTLSETVSSSDIITSNLGITISLSETLNSSDVVSANLASKVSLTETLTPSDAITTFGTVSLTETLTPSDAITTFGTVSLSETLSLSDAVTTFGTVSLSETLSLSDAVTTFGTVSLTETLTPSDAVTTFGTVSLSETLSLSDAVTTFGTVSLTETLTPSDAVTTFGTVSL